VAHGRPVEPEHFGELGGSAAGIRDQREQHLQLVRL
jgi:hypothetical protein